MTRFFLRVDLDGETYGRPWLPFYMETRNEPRRGDIVLARMWCPKHNDRGVYCAGKMICCRFERVMTPEFQKELASREMLLESCMEGRIVVVYDLEGYVEPLVDSIDVKTWNEKDEIETMRYYEFAE